MKKFSKKGVLLFASAMALCAFVMPAMASAASWSPVNSHHTLTSSGIGFTAPPNITSNCSSASFTTRVDSAQVLTITSGSFNGCTSSGAGSIGHCNTVSTPTRFPWRATARTTTDIQIHDVLIDITFSGANCLAPTTFTLTGTLRDGAWTGNGAAQRTVVFSNAEGLTSHLTGSGVTVRGSFTGSSLLVLD